MDWYCLSEPIFSETVKLMIQWKCFNKSHYTRAQQVWLQKALPQSLIISLRDVIPGRQRQSQWLWLWSDYCLLFSRVRPLVTQLQRVIFKNHLAVFFSPLFFQNAYTVTANEAIYQLSSFSIHVYDTNGINSHLENNHGSFMFLFY